MESKELAIGVLPKAPAKMMKEATDKADTIHALARELDGIIGGMSIITLTLRDPGGCPDALVEAMKSFDKRIKQRIEQTFKSLGVSACS